MWVMKLMSIIVCIIFFLDFHSKYVDSISEINRNAASCVSMMIHKIVMILMLNFFCLCRQDPMIKKYFPIDIHSFLKQHSFPTFYSFSRRPILFPDPPHSFSSLLRSQGLRELSGFRAAEMHWFRWKEIDVLFTIVVTLLPRRTQPMADNYRGSESRTGGGATYFTRPFQVPDTRTARGQHGPAARQSRVRIPATD